MNQESAIHQEDQLAIVLGQRQLVAVCCMFLVIIGLVSTLAYVAGRSITAANVRSVSDRAEAAPIVVDPRVDARRVDARPADARPVDASNDVAPPVPAVTEARAQTTPPPPVERTKPSPFENAAPQSAPVAAAHPVPRTSEPFPGEVYWQVGSIERSMASTFTQYLSSQGFRSRLAQGHTPDTVRVLVGPMQSDAEIENTDRALEAAGFQHFLKKY